MNIKAWWKNNDGPAVHDLSRLEERMLGMEAEKDSLQLQVKILKSFFSLSFSSPCLHHPGECVGGSD